MSIILVTVIIPTYHDWERLKLCIKALQEQTLDADAFEVIIVNNQPADLPPSDLYLPANVSLIAEQKPGSYSARNAAIKIAKGSILAFTDSDCIADEKWLENAVYRFKNDENCKRIGGRVKLFYKSGKLNLAELYEKVYAFRQYDIVNREGTSVTANMFTYKYVFDEVGLFDDTLMSGGDFEWGKRAFKAGYEIQYAEDVIVNHPARDDVQELKIKAKRIANIAKLSRGKYKLSGLWSTGKLLIPPVKELKMYRDLSVTEKYRVFGLRYYLRVIRTIESLRLQMGKRANRE